MVAVPVWVTTRMPTRPEAKVPSVAVSIQPLGSALEEGQAFAVSVVPMARKWTEYDVPAVPTNGLLARSVVVPLTFFWMIRLPPSI